jgi:hypothetical protein
VVVWLDGSISHHGALCLQGAFLFINLKKSAKVLHVKHNGTKNFQILEKISIFV